MLGEGCSYPEVLCAGTTRRVPERSWVIGAWQSPGPMREPSRRVRSGGPGSVGDVRAVTWMYVVCFEV
jgi:hypothetical protein